MANVEELEKEVLERLQDGSGSSDSQIVRDVLESHKIGARDLDRWKLEERLRQILFEARLKEMPASEFPGGPRTVVRPPDPTPEPKKRKRKPKKASPQSAPETEEVSVSHPSQPRDWWEKYDNY